MTKAVDGTIRRADLAHADDHELVASGVFQFSGAVYSVEFRNERGLLECLDTMMAFPRKPATPRLYLNAENYTSTSPEWPPSNLRFDFDRKAQVGAAVLLIVDRHEDIHAWMTHGAQDRRDVTLTHDSWNPRERQFPSSALVELADLREAVRQWAFGDALPPPAVGWTPVPDEDIGWL